jgi:hypothetical protein
MVTPAVSPQWSAIRQNAVDGAGPRLLRRGPKTEDGLRSDGSSATLR